jgi:hypothetical protein
MNYDFKLKTVGLLVGLLLVGGHVLAMLKAEPTRRWLASLPRSYSAGVAVLAVDLAWTFWLALVMDWGEFYYLRQPLLFLLPVVFFLTVKFVDDFLFVRALGILGLLAAAPLLDAAFLQPQTSRLLLVVLAYVWIILGMFWIAMPHLLRDQIQWLARSAQRWQAAVFAGIAYGAALLFCALIFWRD